MRRREAAILVLLWVAAACVPAGCDFYDDVVLADTPFAYWRLVRPKDSTDIIADSSKRYMLPLPRFPSLPSFFTPPHHACRCPLPLPRFPYLPSLFTPPHRACLFLLPFFCQASSLHLTTFPAAVPCLFLASPLCQAYSFHNTMLSAVPYLFLASPTHKDVHIETNKVKFFSTCRSALPNGRFPG